MLKRIFAALSAAVVLAIPSLAFAAVETTCLCRSEDGKTFKEQSNRHHRWACDYHFGYLKDPSRTKESTAPTRTRPSTQTCNAEEITQFKVFLCASGGCTYPYARSTNFQNRRLKTIEQMKGERHP